MPSELKDGSSILSQQIAFWNSDGIKDGNADTSLTRKHFDAPNLHLNQITTGSHPLNNNIPNLGHYENGLFSSSLSDLFTTKLRLSAENNNSSSVYGHSVGASRYAAAASAAEEQFESLEEIEAQTIGNLLPDDDDLLSGVTDGLLQPGSGDDVDFFSSAIGGMELGEDETNYQTSLEDPSRTLFVRNISSNMDDSELRSLFEQYGEIQNLYTACKHLGFVMISYYDIRASRRAMQALHNKLLGHTKLDIRYSIPKDKPSDNEAIVSNVRVGIPAGVSNTFIGVESGGLPNQQKYDFRSTPNYHPHSLPNGLINSFSIQGNSPSSMAAGFDGRMPERLGNRQFNTIGGSVNDSVFGNANCSPAATHHYMWNPSHNMILPHSPSLMNGIGNAHRAPSHLANTFLHINNHHVGSAPSVNPSIWDRRNPYESLDTSSAFHPGSLGNMRVPLNFVPPRMELPVPSKSVTHQQNSVMFPSRGGQMMTTSFDSPSDRARNRRNESQADNKKQFELDLDRIMRGEDRRTTLMIKNIPNKYTSKMLLAAIDERHRGTYDFIYLPIDFKNKCNVGYAFINMTEPPLIIPFYQAFNGKKWEKFNSEKVASIAYARIQGKAALIAHFQNSSLMNEDKRCRPILFHTDGPNAGDQVPFPMGVNVRSRANKNRNNEEDHAEASSNSSAGSTKDFQ